MCEFNSFAKQNSVWGVVDWHYIYRQRREGVNINLMIVLIPKRNGFLARRRLGSSGGKSKKTEQRANRAHPPELRSSGGETFLMFTFFYCPDLGNIGECCINHAFAMTTWNGAEWWQSRYNHHSLFVKHFVFPKAMVNTHFSYVHFMLSEELYVQRDYAIVRLEQTQQSLQPLKANTEHLNIP